MKTVCTYKAETKYTVKKGEILMIIRMILEVI